MASVSPNELNAVFWDGCNRGELLVQECQRCGERFFVPEAICPACRSYDWQWRPSEGAGSIYSYTVVHRSFRADLPSPYVVAAIEMDDGWTMMSNIVGCSPDDVRIGMRVDVEFTPGTDGQRLPRFAPSRGELERRS
jgi:uncharacterized OB-fold protein